MNSISQKIMQRMRRHGKGKWVCTPKDFLDLGNRAAIDKALSRLAKSGALRRVKRGFYDLPYFSKLLGEFAVVDTRLLVQSIARRDGIRLMMNGMAAANMLHLTNAVPAQIVYITDGASREIKIGNSIIHLCQAGPSVMSWAGRPAEPVAQALRWLGPRITIGNPSITRTLQQILPDKVKNDLIKNSANLPGWAVPIAQRIATPKEKA